MSGKNGAAHAHLVNRIPHAAATIVPYDVQSRLRAAFPNLPEQRLTARVERLLTRITGSLPTALATYSHPATPDDAIPIGSLRPDHAAIVQGRLIELTDQPNPDGTVLRGQIADDSGTLTIELHGTHPDLEVGQRLRLHGHPQHPDPGHPPTMIDPTYHILVEDPDEEDRQPR